jgi:hypothetical protein
VQVIDALPGIEAPNLTGGTSKMLPNHHITKPVFIGEVWCDYRPVCGPYEELRTRRKPKEALASLLTLRGMP